MHKRMLGGTGMEITPIGLGTWAIGGDAGLGWGPQDDSDSVAAILRTLECGINWIDTAPLYGLGHGEEVVARAVQQLGPSRRPYIFTKCSLVWDRERKPFHSLKAASIRREVEDSLRRLHLDAIDLMQIHWASFPPGSSDSGIEEAWTTLADLKQQGKVRHIGVSNFNVPQLKRVQDIAAVETLQPPYSMLMRDIETEVLPYCAENNIGVLAYSPLHNGLLTGSLTRERIARLPETDWRISFSPAFQEPNLTASLRVVDLLRAVGARRGRTPAEVAIAWVLHNPAVTAAIVGARRPGQVDGFIGALEFRLSPEEYEEISARLPNSVPFMTFDLVAAAL
jgi:aryl-alcohol dehydrogenase-like predicted oxidoreductase